MENLQPQSPNTPRRSISDSTIQLHIDGDPVAVDSRDSNDSHYMLPPIRYHPSQDDEEEEEGPERNDDPFENSSSEEITDEERAWIRRMEELRRAEKEERERPDSRGSQFVLPAVAFNPRPQGGLRVPVPDSVDDPFGDENLRPESTEPSRRNSNSRAQNYVLGASRFGHPAAPHRAVKPGRKGGFTLGDPESPVSDGFPPTPDLVHSDSEPSSSTDNSLATPRFDIPRGGRFPRTKPDPSTIAPGDSASQRASPLTRRHLRVMERHSSPYRDPRVDEYPLFDEVPSPSLRHAGAGYEDFPISPSPRRFSPASRTPTPHAYNTIQHSPRPSRARNQAPQAYNTVQYSPGPSRARNPAQQAHNIQRSPEPYRARNQAPQIRLSPPSSPSEPIRTPPAARFRGNVRFSSPPPRPRTNPTMRQTPSHPVTAPTPLTTHLQALKSQLSPWITWLLQGLILFNVWGLPLSFGCYIEFYYNNLLSHLSLFKIVSIFAVHIFCVLFVTLFAHWISQVGLRRRRNVRVLMVVGMCGTVAGTFLVPFRAAKGEWWWFFATQGVVLGTALGMLNVAGTVTLSGYYDNDVVGASGMLRIFGGIGALVYTAVLHTCLQWTADFGLSCYIIAGISLLTLAPVCVFLPKNPKDQRLPRQSITGTIGMFFSCHRLFFITGYCLIWFSLFLWPTFIVLYISELTWPTTGSKILITMQACALISYVVFGRETVQHDFGVLNIYIFMACVAGFLMLLSAFSFHVQMNYFVAVLTGFAFGALMVLYVKVVHIFNVDIRGRARDNLARTAVLLAMAGVAAAAGVFGVADVADRGPGVVDGKVGPWGHDGWRNGWCVAAGGFLVGSLLLYVARAGLVGWDPLIVV